MYVVTFTDGTTYDCANYETNDGGVRFMDSAGTAQKYAPFHSIEQIAKQGGSSEAGEGTPTYEVTFMDGATTTCAKYEVNDGGVRLQDQAGSVTKYVPFHSIRYISRKS